MGKAKRQAAVPPEDNRNIEATLSALDIEKDTEDAAADAVAEVASSVVVEDEPPVEGAIPIEPEPEPESEPDPLPPPPELEPAASVPPPEERPQRSRRRETAKGAVGRVGKMLAAKVPGGQSVKVYKRTADGKKWYVNHFTTADLSTHDSFESFLTEYVKPEHGPGEYVLTAPDRDPTKEFELGTIRLLGSKPAADQGMTGVLQTMLAQNQSRDADWLERMEKTMQPQPQQNPLELLQGVMDLNERVNGKAGEGEVEAKAAAASSTQNMMDVMQSSGDKTMQMMMMMQQQQAAASDRQMQMMMAMFNKPKEEDPMMKLLLMKLVKDDDSGGSSALPPPPPPPQDNTVALITALGGFMAAMGGGGEGGEDGLKDYLLAEKQAQAGNTLSMKETIELITRKDGDKGNGFKDAVDNMAAIMNITQNVSRQNEGGPAAGLFDALAALFSNRDFAGAIANTIRAKTDQSGAVQKTGIDMAQQRLAMQQRLALQQQQRSLLMTQQQQAAAAAGVPTPAVDPSVPPMITPPPTTPSPLESVGGPPVPIAVPSPITDDQQRRAEAAAQQRQLPQLPSDTHTHINHIAAAQDDAERVERTVRLLIYFSEFSEWRVFVEQLLGYIRDGNREGTMQYLGAFMEGFATIHLVDPTLGKEILRTMDEHFGTLQDQLRDFELAGDRMVTGEDLLQPPEGVVVPIDGAREDADDPGENDDDPGEEDDDPGEEGGEDTPA